VEWEDKAKAWEAWVAWKTSSQDLEEWVAQAAPEEWVELPNLCFKDSLDRVALEEWVEDKTHSQLSSAEEVVWEEYTKLNLRKEKNEPRTVKQILFIL
jgi:hypothetical protein